MTLNPKQCYLCALQKNFEIIGNFTFQGPGIKDSKKLQEIIIDHKLNLEKHIELF